MFTINISFKDALTCYEALSTAKAEEELQSIESEFLKYAQKQAKTGDSAAAAWLKQNDSDGEQSNVDEASSPMQFFIGMERPSRKDKQLKELEDLENQVKVDLSENTDIAELSAELLFEKDKNSSKKKDASKKLNRKMIQKAMKPLNDLVGLGQVKQKIQSILEQKIIEQRRKSAGLKVSSQSANHMVFTGRPGTGKTTVARRVATIFKDLGFLSKGHLTEVSRADLIGEYIGQTEQVVKEIVDKARGGVLFIDEAYSLYKPDSQNDFGHDIISALIKYMEDDRRDLVVIMAGYTELMSGFLRSNPGLKSRIQHSLEFDDMEEDQLFEIFKVMCKDHDYVLDLSAEDVLKKHIKELKRRDISEFPNARGVRNLFEHVIRKQSQRLLDEDVRSKKKLALILEEDIPHIKTSKTGNVVHLPRD